MTIIKIALSVVYPMCFCICMDNSQSILNYMTLVSIKCVFISLLCSNIFVVAFIFVHCLQLDRHHTWIIDIFRRMRIVCWKGVRLSEMICSEPFAVYDYVRRLRRKQGNRLYSHCFCNYSRFHYSELFQINTVFLVDGIMNVR